MTTTKKPQSGKPSFLKARQAIKVLKSGRSFHGGKLVWKLPKLKDVKDRIGLELSDPNAWIPGDWMPKIQNVRVCNRGYHLTHNAAHWWAPTKHCKAYIAEYRGAPAAPAYSSNHKIAVAEVRLIRELTTVELREFGILHEGSHGHDDVTNLIKAHNLKELFVGGSADLHYELSSTPVRLYGSAKAQLRGLGNVGVYEQASVAAYNSVHVDLRGGRTRLYGSSSASAYAGVVTLDNPGTHAHLRSKSVRAQLVHGTATVDCGGRVVITGSGSVDLRDGSVDDLGGSSTIALHGRVDATRQINMGDKTVVIDRTYEMVLGVPRVYTSAKPFPHTIPPKAPKVVKAPASAVPPAKTKPAAKKRK